MFKKKGFYLRSKLASILLQVRFSIIKTALLVEHQVYLVMLVVEFVPEYVKTYAHK